MRTLRELDPQNKRVLVRVDYNVPIEAGRVVDDNRIVESLDTLRYLLDHRARIVIISHLGRPEGKRDPQYSLRPVVRRLKELLLERKITAPIRFCTETIGREAQHMVEATKPGEIVVLENLRFDPREEQNDPQFSAELASLAETYVDDAFGTMHDPHASIVSVPKLLPSYAGLLVEKEVKTLENLISDPEHPFVVILGGAKPDKKVSVMDNLSNKVDRFLVAGGIANTFLKIKGFDIKDSLSGDDSSFAIAKELLRDLGSKLIVPTDFIWEGNAIMDVGPGTIATFEQHILQAKTIFWNGNLGKSEDKRYAKGTRAIAKALAATPAKSVVGGGDTVAAIDQFRLRKHIFFISTGGGATLEFLAGKSLPGLEVLGYRPKA